MEEMKLTVIYYKILDTVYYLNNIKHYPNELGVFKIISGVVDQETITLSNCPTFSTLISCRTKKISRCIMMLKRYNYLSQKYDKDSDDMFLVITPKGEAEVLAYHKKRKSPYKTVQKIFKKTILKKVDKFDF